MPDVRPTGGPSSLPVSIRSGWDTFTRADEIVSSTRLLNDTHDRYQLLADGRILIGDGVSPPTPILDGVLGIAGPTGPTGAAGATGAIGATGATGPQGTPGANGSNGVGVPTGGTISQILSKLSGADFDTAWIALVASVVLNTPAGGIAATTVQAAINELDTEKAASVHGHAGADITSGTVADARIASTITRDSELTAALVPYDARLDVLESRVFTWDVGYSGVLTSNGEAANTTALQDLINFFVALGGNVNLYFGPGIFKLNNITVKGDRIRFVGLGELEYHGAVAGDAFITYKGVAMDTTLTANMTDVQTTAEIASAAGAPATPFDIAIGAEIMTVATRVGTSLSSITRHVKGTTATTHTSGDEVLQDNNSTTTRLIGVGIIGLDIKNAGNSDSSALRLHGVSGARFRRVNFSGWRRHVATGNNFADSDFDQCGWDFSGGGSGLGYAVLKFGGVPSKTTAGSAWATSTSWAADSLKWSACRFENNGDAICDFRPIGTSFFCNKLYFVDGTKFENSNEDSNGISWDGAGSRQFYFEKCSGVVFDPVEITLQGMQSASYSPNVDAMFHFNDCQHVYVKAFMPFGSLGASKPVFDFLFLLTDCDQTRFLCTFTAGNTGCDPIAVFSFAGTNTGFSRDGSGWGYHPGTPPIADWGDAPSSSAWSRRRSFKAVSVGGAIVAEVTHVTTGASDRTMTLESAVGREGMAYVIAKVDAAGSGRVILDPAGTETISGAGLSGTTATCVTLAQASLSIRSNGVGWIIEAKDGTWSTP